MTGNERKNDPIDGPNDGLKDNNDRPRDVCLMLGASGMLRAAALEQSLRQPVLLVARREHVLAEIVKQSAERGGEVIPLALDYGEGVQALQSIHRTLQQRNLRCISAVLWVHSHAQEFCVELISTLLDLNATTSIVHVLGSAAAQPQGVADGMLSLLDTRGINRDTYRQVVLGFVLEGGNARWLSHAEISRGVLDALHDTVARSVVGTLTPWERRP